MNNIYYLNFLIRRGSYDLETDGEETSRAPEEKTNAYGRGRRGRLKKDRSWWSETCGPRSGEVARSCDGGWSRWADEARRRRRRRFDEGRGWSITITFSRARHWRSSKRPVCECALGKDVFDLSPRLVGGGRGWHGAGETIRGGWRKFFLHRGVFRDKFGQRWVDLLRGNLVLLLKRVNRI